MFCRTVYFTFLVIAFIIPEISCRVIVLRPSTAAMDDNITMGTVIATRSKNRILVTKPEATPAPTAMLDITMCLSILLSDHKREGIAEAIDDIRIEYAAPKIPYSGTRIVKETRKTAT